MKITDIKIRKLTGTGKLKAFVTVTFDECFVVHNIKILEVSGRDQGSNGYTIAMPSRRIKSGTFKDIAHPIHHEFRDEMQSKIMEKFNSGDFSDN
jgi:stage V sporulation protein G